MKKNVHIIIAIALVILQLTIITGADDIMPLWDNIKLVSCEVTFDGTDGSVYSRIKGYTDATEIKGTLILYEGDEEIKRWDIAEEDYYWSVLYSFEGKTGTTYSLELDAEVYKDGLWEPVTASDSTKCE